VKVTALRNVCAGVGVNLKAGESAEIREDDAKFLVEIGAAQFA
jgi:hypothetical protein